MIRIFLLAGDDRASTKGYRTSRCVEILGPLFQLPWSHQCIPKTIYTKTALDTLSSLERNRVPIFRISLEYVPMETGFR